MCAGWGLAKSTSLSTRRCTTSASTDTCIRASFTRGAVPFAIASRWGNTSPMRVPQRNPTESCGAELTPSIGVSPTTWLAQSNVPSPPTVTTRS